MAVIFLENFFFGHLQFRDFLGISMDEGGLLAVIRRFWVSLETLDCWRSPCIFDNTLYPGGPLGSWRIPWLLEDTLYPGGYIVSLRIPWLLDDQLAIFIIRMVDNPGSGTDLG